MNVDSANKNRKKKGPIMKTWLWDEPEQENLDIKNQENLFWESYRCHIFFDIPLLVSLKKPINI